MPPACLQYKPSIDRGPWVEKILMSACLLGKRVRYDGRSLPVADVILEQWLAEGRILSVCPEVEAGMGIPRPPAEIIGGDGDSVLEHNATVIESHGQDVTGYFEKGAHIALALCQRNNIKIAVLADSSPSCGSTTIYDGTFTGVKRSGVGVTTALLRKHGIQVFSQHDIPKANEALQVVSA